MSFNDDVEAERQRQRDKWGEQNHSLAWWYVILGEEFGEVGRDIFEGNNPREELIQVAAVARAIVEQIDSQHVSSPEPGTEAVCARWGNPLSWWRWHGTPPDSSQSSHHEVETTGEWRRVGEREPDVGYWFAIYRKNDRVETEVRVDLEAHLRAEGAREAEARLREQWERANRAESWWGYEEAERRSLQARITELETALKDARKSLEFAKYDSAAVRADIKQIEEALKPTITTDKWNELQQ